MGEAKRRKLMDGVAIPAGAAVPDTKLSKEQEQDLRNFRQFKVGLAQNFLSRIDHPQGPITDEMTRNRCLLDMWSGAAMALIMMRHSWGPLMMLSSHIIAQKGEDWVQLIAAGDDDEATRTRM